MTKKFSNWYRRASENPPTPPPTPTPTPTPSPAAKIPATSITFTFSESQRHRGEHTVTQPNVWQKAEMYARALSHYGPPIGYHKTDFVVTFADGNKYAGTLDIEHSSKPNNDLNVAKHVREFATFYSGRLSQHPRMTPEEYQKIVGRYQQTELDYYGDILDKYQIGDS